MGMCGGGGDLGDEGGQEGGEGREALEALSTALDRIDAQLVEHRSNQPVKPAHMLDDGWCC